MVCESRITWLVITASKTVDIGFESYTDHQINLIMTKGKERLAPSGYYIEYYGNVETKDPESYTVIHISEDQKCKYIHFKWGVEWYTLMWSAAPTSKGVNESKGLENGENGYRYIYYKTHADMVNNQPNLKECAKIPSPIDKNI